MSVTDGWAYYKYGGIDGDVPLYYRYRRGVAELYSPTLNRWVPGNAQQLSRYIELGEIMLSETSRRAIERELDVTLPA